MMQEHREEKLERVRREERPKGRRLDNEREGNERRMG